MFKKLKLAPKLAIVIGSCLAIILTILIVLTTLMSSRAISRSISGELSAISRTNGQQVQQIFDAAATVAEDIQTYIARVYEIADINPVLTAMPTTEEAAIMNQSEIYDKTLSSLNYDMELYVRESARNVAANNEDIAGVGVMFEPYAFQKDMKDFAFYVAEGNADADIKPFGAYQTYSVEPYYKEAATSKQAGVTEPYEYNGIQMVSYAIPILHNSKLQGVVRADINLTNFQKVNSSSEEYPSMYATIYNDNMTIIYNSKDSATVGRSISEFIPIQSEMDAVQAGMAKGEQFSLATTGEDGIQIMRFFTPITAGSETWWSLTALDETDVNEAVTQTVTWLLILSIAALALLVLIVVLVLQHMLKPLKPVMQAAKQIASGNLEVELTSSSQDEIGILTDIFMGMTCNLKTMVNDVDYMLSSMAEGNFDIYTKAEESYVGSFRNFLLSMRKMNGKLSQTLGEINSSADHVSTGSEQVSAGAQALSQGTTEQASSIEELAATINDISVQVKGNAENAQQASMLAEEAGSKMTQSNQQMQDMIVAMDEISDKSGQIGKIIKTIEDIAFQTNILALNAAVEAARAGAAGKGFAVVADEVRNLASKSAEASKSTSTLIEGSIKAVENGTRIADHAARTMLETVEGAQQVIKIIEEISKASSEQASSIVQVTQGIDQISNVVQTNSATAEESAAASEELSSQAQILKSLVGQFRLKEIRAMDSQNE